ncbi:MAG: cupin domain-containing protein, partial [Anaerolineae bacterium]
METRLVKFGDVKPVYAFQGIARRALNWGEQAMLLQNNFTPGTGVPEHAHANEQISYVVEGTLVVVVSGVSYTLNAGDSLLMP